MPDVANLDLATSGFRDIPQNWIAPTQVRPLVFRDPVIVWLVHHGAAYGFKPDDSPYEFADFIFHKAQEFEAKWMHEVAGAPARVCDETSAVRSLEKVKKTLELMRQGVPAIAQPALWWAPERIFGIPDLIAKPSWVRERFPGLIAEVDSEHYVVFDVKFTTNLDDRRKQQDFDNYGVQVRFYTYMLGHLQGRMPSTAFLVARDRILNPLPIPISSAVGLPLDPDLAELRDTYLDIKIDGADRLPWRDNALAPNLANTADDPWRAAKIQIAQERIPGGDPALIYQIGSRSKEDLAARGFDSIQSLLDAEPASTPLEECHGLGERKARQIRAILQANRSGQPVRPPTDILPPHRLNEFYIDFEYFTNVNVDFETQWPALDGCEMVFMIGVGWEDDGKWNFRNFIASNETRSYEQEMFSEFLAFLDESTGGATRDAETTALYHWTSAEVWQLRRACDRFQYPPGHPLRLLPCFDLQRAPFLDGPTAIPGAWDYSLKEITRALGEHDPRYAVQWPGELDKGLRAMVMGWKAYESETPLETEEMRYLQQYLQADCKALWAILRWLRAGDRR